MESGVLQDVLRETVIGTLASELPSHMGHSHRRLLVLHLLQFPKVYDGSNSTPLRWSATVLGGAVATIIMIAATIAEFSYIATTWNNNSHLTCRLLFLLVTFGLTAGPTFYITIAESRMRNQTVPLILGIVQFSISAVATLIFVIVPSGRMFRDRIAGKSRKYYVSQTLTASHSSMTTKQQQSSGFLWFLVFGCKFAELYWFLTHSFRESIDAMVGMKVRSCNKK